MEAKENIYYRSDYVRNYSLTEEEYLLLPYLARMSYSQVHFHRILSDLKEVGNEVIIYAYLPDCFEEFFKDSGCEVKKDLPENPEDDGLTTITRITNEVRYNKEPGMDFRVNTYLYNLAQAKATIFEDVLKKSIEAQVKTINNQGILNLDQETPASILKRITSSPIKDMCLKPYNQDYLIHQELSILMEELESNYFTIKRPSDEYIDFLRRKGYMINEDENCISIYKPSKKDNKELSKSYPNDLQKQ